jgi:beta-lactam-binding protein with PASTA domain
MVLRRIAKIALLMCTFMVLTGISTYLTIHLLIRGEDTVVVPQLTGKEVVYALQLLSDLGLNTKVKGSEFSTEVPKNQVISQDPEPGSEVKKGRDVRIVISKGARTVIMPNVTGLGVPQAHILLEENDLGQGELSYTYSEDRSREEILSQYPLPGARRIRGNRVDLLISAGPRPARIPMADLKDMNVTQAIQVLERLQLTTGTIKTVQDLSMANDIVVDHSPRSGYPIAKGSAVDLVINRYKRSEAVDRREILRLFRYRTTQGFLKQHIRVRLTRPDTAVDLFNEFVRPDREIWLLVPRDESATVLLYVDNELVKTVHYD